MSGSPTDHDVRRTLTERSNWGRWGADDQAGTINLLTDEKRLADLAVVREGRCFSLAHDIVPNVATESGAPTCALSTHELKPGSTAAMDHFGLSYHGFTTTHLDALCHIALDGQVWNGRAAADELQPDGARWADVTAWSAGIVTRAVLLDVPHHRGTDFVAADAPVHGDELDDLVAARGLTLHPGDAVLVHSGRTAWSAANGPWESVGPRWVDMAAPGVRPGLHASCMEFLRDHDVSVLLWDMLDLAPSGYSYAWSVHGSIAAFGLAVIDNVASDELAADCRRRDRWEFLLTVAPLRVRGGTGCPVNPLAMV